jgi:tol-pal system protein YbgF
MISRIGGAAASAALFSVLFAAMASSPSPSFAQDQRLENLVNRMERLERDLGTLSRQVYNQPSAKGPTPNLSAPPSTPLTGDAYSRIEGRLQQMESEMTALTGNVETLTHSNSELKAQLERLQKDIDLRIGDLEKGGAPRAGQPLASASGSPGTPPREGVLGSMSEREPAQKGAPPDSGSRHAALPQGTPQQQYDYALSLLGKSDYAGASQAFQEFLDKNPNSPLASNARYWLGESYYVRKDYTGAARVFLDGYTKDQKGSKAPDTLLKLGMSLTNLDKKKEACATYDKLAKDFPDAASSIKQRIPAERKRAGCG